MGKPVIATDVVGCRDLVVAQFADARVLAQYDDFLVRLN